MGEDLVDLVQVAQLARDALEALQPARVAAGVTELARLLLDQVRTLVPPGRLQRSNQTKNRSVVIQLALIAPLLSLILQYGNYASLQVSA